jgi:hypothetical protein
MVISATRPAPIAAALAPIMFAARVCLGGRRRQCECDGQNTAQLHREFLFHTFVT